MGQKKQSQSLLSGAAILMLTTAASHLIGMLYKIPITAIIGEVGRGYFTSAYELYTPVYAVSMAGLPVAVSKMISERMASHSFSEVRRLKKVSTAVFMLTGLIGTLTLLILAYPFSKYVIKSPNAFYSIAAIAPSVFFCCIMSAHRGYYEGLRNMLPTGISELFETLGKFIFGVLLSWLVLKEGLRQYSLDGRVFGVNCCCEREALFAVAPYSAAAAIFGVTLGTILGMLYILIKYKIHGDGISEEELLLSPEPASKRSLAKSLVSTAVPIALSSVVLNITNLIDSITVQSRLKTAVLQNASLIREIYPEIAKAGLPDELIKDFLYGCYGVALDFRGLIPTIIMTLGVSAIPVLSAAKASKDSEGMRRAVESVIKTSVLLSVPAGLSLAALSKPLLRLLYFNTNSTSTITIAAPITAVFGIFALLISISMPVTNMLQAIGRSDVPVKSLLVGALVKIICNYILVGTPRVNINGAPVGTVLCYLIIVGSNLFMLLRETGVKPDWSDCLIRPFAAGAAAGAAALGFYHSGLMILPAGNPLSRFNGDSLSCLLSVVLTVLLWLILLFVFKILSKDELSKLPKGEKLIKSLEKLGALR